MKTLTVTKARGQLGDLIRRAIQGEDIGVVHSPTGKIVALHPVEASSEDYALREYGVTKKELDRSYRKVTKEIRKERAAGKLKPFDL